MRIALAPMAMFAAICYVAVYAAEPYEGPQVPAAGRYQTVFVEGMWQRVDVDTGDVCFTDLSLGEWFCTEQVNMLLELQALEQEQAPEPKWFNDPSTKRGNA